MAKKKVEATRTLEKRELIEIEDQDVPVTRQCELLGLPKSTYYYKKADIPQEDVDFMNAIDKVYTKYPYYGARRISREMRNRGFNIGRKRVRRLMRIMGIQAIYQKPNTSKPNPEHKVYPYLLKGMVINKPNQVWCTDITYIRLAHGWGYLMAVMDWHSRRVISWGVSSTMDVEFCIRVLEDALKQGKPQIFNTDQGSQYTSVAFTDVLKREGIDISMDGRGRYLDNIFIERLWRTVKYENVFINGYRTIPELRVGLEQYFLIYNHERIHQALGYVTPDSVWRQAI